MIYIELTKEDKEKMEIEIMNHLKKSVEEDYYDTKRFWEERKEIKEKYNKLRE